MWVGECVFSSGREEGSEESSLNLSLSLFSTHSFPLSFFSVVVSGAGGSKWCWW